MGQGSCVEWRAHPDKSLVPSTFRGIANRNHLSVLRRVLVDVRAVPELPPTREVQGILVIDPPELIAYKVIAFRQRRGRPKSGTDWRDLAMLLLKFPELKMSTGPVHDRLAVSDADSATMATWEEIVGQDITAEGDDEEF